jgi:raffinose/stachyose/melibiose transport system permease protein
MRHPLEHTVRDAGAAPAAAPARRTDTVWRAFARSRTAYLLLLPTFILMGVFVYYPPLSAMFYSLTDWDPTRTVQRFIGLANYQTVLSSTYFGQEVGNMVVLLVAFVAVTVTVPLIVAELIYAVRNPGLRYSYRFLFLVPVVVPLVVTLLMWEFFYDPSLGPINAILSGLGLKGADWLGDPHTALPAIIFVGFPWISGTNVLIYLAGLMNIPGEVMEAAALDGATGLQRIRRIDLPLLLGQVRLFIILGTIGALQAFQVQLIITNPPGGPGYNTSVPALEMYNALGNQRYGIGAAIGVLLFLVAFALTLVNFQVVRSSVTEGTA